MLSCCRSSARTHAPPVSGSWNSHGCWLFAVTDSKVIHQSAVKGPSQSPQPPPIVSNFAAAPRAVVNKISASAQADGGSASDVARSCFAHLSKVQRRTPARPQATIPRSDRTQAREALVTARPRGGGQSQPASKPKPKPMILTRQQNSG